MIPNYRTTLFEMAMVCFSRRHAANLTERRAVREKLHDFFLYGRLWREWKKLQK
jgi:hypothetical protein